VSRYIISLKGCSGNSLDGLYGFILGTYIGGCSLSDEDDVSLKIICSKEFADEPGPRKLFIHNGWAYNFIGYHILYGVDSDLKDIVNVFSKATGSKEGFILNLPIGQNKYLTGLISENELIEIHIHSKKLWRGVFGGLIGCLLCSESDLSSIFNTVIDYLDIAIHMDDPLYYFRRYSSEAIEYEKHFKYINRLLRSSSIYLSKIIVSSAILASKPRYSNRVISTRLVKTPINVVVLGPHELVNDDIIKKYLLSNEGALLCFDSKLPAKIIDELRAVGLRVIDINDRTIIWSYDVKNLILSLEKVFTR